jgi:hypothetical protein
MGPRGAGFAAKATRTCTFDDDSDLEEANSTCPVNGHKDPVRSVCCSPCGTKIVSGGGLMQDDEGGKDFLIRIWDAEPVPKSVPR